MGNTKKAGEIDKKSNVIVNLLLICVVSAMALYTVPVYADEGSVDSEVTVVSPAMDSYGHHVAASSGVFLSWQAIGEPDLYSSWILSRGWISLALESTITDCRSISIWLAKSSWGSARFNVYASPDGSNWTYVGDGSCTSGSYARHDFSGTYGEVRYVRVERGGSWSWSILLLDAVYAKGGDA